MPTIITDVLQYGLFNRNNLENIKCYLQIKNKRISLKFLEHVLNLNCPCVYSTIQNYSVWCLHMLIRRLHSGHTARPPLHHAIQFRTYSCKFFSLHQCTKPLLLKIYLDVCVFFIIFFNYVPVLETFIVHFPVAHRFCFVNRFAYLRLFSQKGFIYML